jgi:hypothetical protein
MGADQSALPCFAPLFVSAFVLQGDDGSISRDRARSNLAAAEISEGNNLVFTGALFTRGAFAEVGAELNPLLPGGEQRLAGTEGITMRVKSEGHTYACVLRTGRYWAGVRLAYAACNYTAGIA